MSYNFWQFLDGLIQYELEEESRRLDHELKQKRRRIARSLNNRENNIRYHKLINEHFASAKLADTAFSLLRRAANELHKIDELIKQAKLKRKACRAIKNFSKADDITQLITQLAKIYADLKQERDTFNARTRALNDNTAELRESIRNNCGARGAEWYERLQARKHLN